MAWPRCKDSRGMLADVSIKTVTESLFTRRAAHGPASATTSAANAAHFSAKDVCDAPGAFRITIHRRGSSPNNNRKMGWSNVTPSPAYVLRIAELGPFAFLDCELAELRLHGGSRLTDEENVDHLKARIGLLQRVWGADPAFLARHSARYRRGGRNLPRPRRRDPRGPAAAVAGLGCLRLADLDRRACGRL